MAEAQQVSDDDTPSDPVFQIKNVIADKNMVVIHTALQSRSDKTKGFRKSKCFYSMETR